MVFALNSLINSNLPYMEISCLCDTSLNSKESQCVNCLVFGQWLWCFKSASKLIKARLTSLFLLQD